jgi:cytochrome c-type biogenesis protein CcmH/NrfG
MAEIHVQAKKQSSNTVWLWIVLALALAVALVYYLLTRNTQTEVAPATPPGTTSQLKKSPRPPKPVQVKIIIPVVDMRSV